MSTSWINFLYKHITEEEENERTSSSLDVLSKANIWIKDLPTNNLEPLEESFGARRMKMKVGFYLLLLFLLHYLKVF